MPVRQIDRDARSRQVSSIGQSGFVHRHGLRTAAQDARAEEVRKLIADERLELVRVCYVDQHGLVRGKSVTTADFLEALGNGMYFNTGPLSMDTSSRVFLPIFSADGGLGIPGMGGGSDVVAVPDPGTFRIVPWADGTGWILCDLYMRDGQRVPFDTRYILSRALARLGELGYAYVAGLEIEFYVFKIDNPRLQLHESGWPADPPDVSAIGHGYQYHSETHIDARDGIYAYLKRHLVDFDVPLRSMEDEWGPGQCEFTFDPQVGLDSADTMIMFRSVVKQLCARRGLLATFMCKPGLPNIFTSGWHLHESLRDLRTGENAFTSPSGLLSDTGRQSIGGLLEHANATTLFAVPTITGYKRLNDSPLAPSRPIWAEQNRAAMLRVIGGPGDPGTHVENRIGDPAANPYLFMASQVLAAIDGIERRLDPGAPRNDNPYAHTDVPRLPGNLAQAIEAVAGSQLMRNGMGTHFIDYYLAMKRHELNRFESHVTDWEQREYLEVF